MIDQTPYIGSRPMPLDTKTNRLQARASAAAVMVCVVLACLAAVALASWAAR